MSLLEVRDLSVVFDTREGKLAAVDGVSFDVEAGETLGLVGESGSGKSMTCLAILGLVPEVRAGSVRLEGRDLLALPSKELRRVRGKTVSIVFQDPMTSLNPLLTVGRQLTEVLEVHEGLPHREARKRSAAGLGDVGVPDPEARLDAYPHELSGGLRQRVMIAMALLCKPKVLLADEPTTALDVTIQAQILELLEDLQHRHGTAIVLVTHDLGVVARCADRVHVMYAGRLVEKAPTTDLFRAPRHPYTRALLRSVPDLDAPLDCRIATIEGRPPDLARLAGGCAFAPRCELARVRCHAEVPPLEAVGTGRESACFEVERLEELG